jgi:hypothetical protein
MSEKMVRTQVYLPADIYEQLKERGEREGLTLAHQIREALAEYVATVAEDKEELPIITEDDPIWNIIGMVEGGPVDGSINHDKYIYTRDWDPEPESAS